MPEQMYKPLNLLVYVIRVNTSGYRICISMVCEILHRQPSAATSLAMSAACISD